MNKQEQDVKRKVALKVELEDEEACALARFCKQVNFVDIRRRAMSEKEAYLMRWALDAVCRQLREKGYDPQ
jgi:hypothetical protein